MQPFAIILLFFMVLGAFIVGAACTQTKTARILFATAALGWAGLMFMAASWAERFNYNIWYSSAASKMLEACITAIESGREDLALGEMKRMTNELDVTYERRGNFNDLAERAAQRLAGPLGEPAGAENGRQPNGSGTNGVSSAAGSSR